MSLTLEWNNDQDIMEIPETWIARFEQLMQITGEIEGVGSGEVALTFVDDEKIQQLNREYRGIDRPTDVLSFAMRETVDGEPDLIFQDGLAEPLGDIVISVQRAVAQAEEYGHSLERELGFLFVHGLLHLLGYDHQDEQAEKKMFDKQEKILTRAGLKRE